jgi:23S rRNA pseudouridine1911/1915/1917 synthase
MNMTRWNQGFEFREILGADAAGLRLIEYLTGRYPAFTREDWLERIESGRVLLDGIPSTQSALLRPGQPLSWLRPPWEEPEAPRSFAILYRDAHLLAVAKPAGLPTLPGGGGFMDNTLLALVRRHFPEAGALHRLGRGTSGIVLFATTREAASKTSQSWRCGEILKVYRALAAGCPADDEFEIDVPIGPVPHLIIRSVYAACAAGKSAHSHVQVLERRDACSLLQVKITTGRPHQIRIHLAAAGHPLVGDPLYIAGGIPAEDCRALPGDLGYLLHNALLGFPHPATGKWTEIHCMPPPSLRLHFA